MGKSQKKKAMRRHNPVRVPDSHLPHGLATASSTSSKNEAILPIIQKLGSVEAAERIWACAAVSNLIQNDPSTRRLLQGKNIVGALITRLSDAVEEVIVEAAGSLRNLCIDGGYDICAEMYNKNILAPLKTFPAKISITLQQFLGNQKNASDEARRLVYNLAESVITIFWCLSETSNKALNAVNDANLIPFLMALLQARDHLPLSTANAAAQCLYVLTEDNKLAIDILRSECSYINSLVDIAQSELPFPRVSEEGNKSTRWMTLRVLVSGILRNIIPLPTVIPASSIDLERTIILPLLVPRLSLNLEEVTASVLQLLGSLPEPDAISTKLSTGHAPRSDHKTASEKEIDSIEDKLRVVQLSLEILTGVCAKLPDPEPVLEEDIPGMKRVSSSSDVNGAIIDDEMDDEMEMDSELDEGVTVPPHVNGTVQPATKIERKAINSLLSTLTGPLIALVHPTTLSFPPNPSEPSPHPPTTSALGTIHIRALECLNNLFLAIKEAQCEEGSPGSAFSTEDREAATALWKELWLALAKLGTVIKDGKMVASRGLERKTEMWEIAMGVLWGIARVGRRCLAPDAEQVEALMEFCDATADDMTRVKCIGALECVAQNVTAIEANKIISTYLLAQISSPSPTHIESCLQSASALVDIYSDETAPYDVNFRQGQWVDVLERALPTMRKLVRGIDRRKAGGMELRGRGDEVLANLVAFIKYRKGLKG